MVGAEGSFWGSGVDEKGSKLGLGTGAGDVGGRGLGGVSDGCESSGFSGGNRGEGSGVVRLESGVGAWTGVGLGTGAGGSGTGGAKGSGLSGGALGGASGTSRGLSGLLSDPGSLLVGSSVTAGVSGGFGVGICGSGTSSMASPVSKSCFGSPESKRISEVFLPASSHSVQMPCSWSFCQL